MKPSKSTPRHSHASLAVLALALFSLTANPASAATTEIFATAGTFTWTCPAAVTSVKVECWGGGGAGGGSFVNGGTANAGGGGGGGGGGGAYAALINVQVTPGIDYTITIPAAATCPTSGFTNGQKFDGSPVTFTGDGAISVTANGGAGGGSAVVTTATAISGAAGAGGAAGTGLSATWKGGNAIAWSGGNGGGGGGGAGDLGAGGNSAASNGSFGTGGAGIDTDHTGGNGGASKNGAGSGNTAASPGGGGGGAKSTAASASSRAGGNGGLGRIILTYTPVFPIILKENNTLPLSGGTSWVGGFAPDASKVAKWDSRVTSANTTGLGANVTWAGIAIENPSGLVTITGPNTLTLATGGIDLSTAHTANLTLNCPIALAAANNWDVAATRTLTLGGQVSGAFPVIKQGAGRVILSTPNTYTGNTTISAGTLQLGASNVIPNGAATGNVTVTGTLDLNGLSETLNGLSGIGIIDNLAAATTSTLTVGSNDQSGTFNGVIKNTGASATLNLTKTGTGTQILGGANTLSGAVSITGGTLAVSNIAPLANVTGITMGDATTLRPDVTNAAINAPITLGTVGTTSTITAPNVAGSGTTTFPFNIGGAVSGAGNLTLAGVSASNAYGAINLNAASNYTGTTLITCSDELAAPTTLGNQNIFVRLFVTNALPVTTVLTLDGGDGAPLASAPGRYCEFNLNGNNQALAGLTNVTGRSLRVQRIVNSSATTATLTVNNALPHTYTGQLGWVTGVGSTAYDNFNLTKNGVGVQTFNGSLRYDGNTTVTGGTLSLGTINPNNEFSSVTIGASGVLQLTFVGSDTVDKLFINGIQQPAGTYGHSSTGATNGGGGSLDAYFATGTGTLIVTSGPGYASWQAANSTAQTIDLDHDSDGVRNGIEYFLGGSTNTTGFTALPGITNTLSTLSITWPKAGTYLGTYGTDFWVETSATLTGIWTPAALGAGADQVDIITVPGNVKYTFPTGTKNFARLKVTGP